MDALTLDQFVVFAAIVDEGSFAAAARRLGRAQSAITYAIQKLEALSGVILFDRAAYRPRLTDAGRALLPRARRILEDLDDFRSRARGVAQSLEAEVSLTLVAMVPIELATPALKAFHAAFPLVQLRLTTERQDTVLEALAQERADLALMVELPPPAFDLERHICGELELVAVAAPNHPLAAVAGPVEPEQLQDHLQIVLTVGPQPQDQRDYGVLAINRWYVADLKTKYALLLEGVGWGSMPRQSVAYDLSVGRLVQIHPTRWDGADHMPRFPLVVASLRGRALGPAALWLRARLAAGADAT